MAYLPSIATLAVYLLASALIVVAWNAAFRPVSWRVAAVLWLFCTAYMAPTLFTSRIDVPANLAFVAYPWKATGEPPVQANTGIIFAQIAPWSRAARDVLRDGEAPLWNRGSSSGAPLLANQQTAIYHPFTLLGLLLPLGKAFTLSAALRLFLVSFFTFILLRNWDLGRRASLFGALAYTFSSFHIVWLLFPLGLSTMMLPLCLVGVQELISRPKRRSYILLVIGLSLAVLGGHPESALWVWIVTALFATVTGLMETGPLLRRRLLIVSSATAFIAAMLLTSFFWWPTLRALQETPRFQTMQSRDANPADHGLSREWLIPFVAPNLLGTPVNGTYAPPAGFHPAVLNDYGEVASSYAGLMTLGLALAAPFFVRRRAVAIGVGLMLFSILTVAEAPLWRDLLREIPLVGISIHQRLRIFWNLGVCIAAASAIDLIMREGERRRIALIGISVAVASFAVLYASRQPDFLRTPLGFAQAAIPVATSVIAIAVLRWRRFGVIAAMVLLFCDLVAATWRYNPAARPENLYPVTGAIEALQSREQPFRFAALGWSFLPDTPSYYGLEDVKTTDPVQNARYMRLLRGYLDVDPASYDLLIRDVSQPFFDFLNIRYVYVPPDQAFQHEKYSLVYRGSDGAVFENRHALPRYFLVNRIRIEPNFEHAVWHSREIIDYRDEALVDHIPAKVRQRAPELQLPGFTFSGGNLRLVGYGPNTAEIEIESRGWNLLVSSDVHWPGWRAYWNGQRQPPVIVNGAFVGCFVPPGRGRLLLRYAPDEFTKGLRLGGITALLLTLTLLISPFVLNGLRLRRREAGSASPS